MCPECRFAQPKQTDTGTCTVECTACLCDYPLHSSANDADVHEKCLWVIIMLWNHPSATHVRNISKKTLRKDGVTNLHDIWEQVSKWGKSVTGDNVIRSMPRISSMADLKRICNELFQAIDGYQGDKLRGAKAAVFQLEEQLQLMINNTEGSLWTARPRDVDLRQWRPCCLKCKTLSPGQYLTCERCLGSWHATTQCTALEQPDIDAVFSWKALTSASSAATASSSSPTARAGCSSTGNEKQRKWWCLACESTMKSAFKNQVDVASATSAATAVSPRSSTGGSSATGRCRASTGGGASRQASINAPPPVAPQTHAKRHQPAIAVGALVEAYHRDTKRFFPAKVVSYDDLSATYTVDWEDGDDSCRTVPTTVNGQPGVSPHFTIEVKSRISILQMNLLEVARAAHVDKSKLQEWLARNLTEDQERELDKNMMRWMERTAPAAAPPAAARADCPNDREASTQKRSRNETQAQPMDTSKKPRGRPRGRPPVGAVWNAETGQYEQQ